MSSHFSLYHLYDHLIFISHQRTVLLPQNPDYFFPLKEYFQSNVMLIFYLDQKLKAPVENFSGALKGEERRWGEGERGNE